MTTHTATRSPQIYARIGGALYLLIIVIGFSTQFFVRDKLIVSEDVTATADNIMASASLWRMGIAGELIMRVFDVVVMLTLYLLLRPVNKNLAMLAVLFNLIQTAVLAAYALNLWAALLFLGNATYLKVFEPQQLQALTYLSVRSYAHGFGIGLIFFGFVCLIQGYLLFKSGYFPRIIGVLMAIAGLSYLTNSFTLLLAPTLAAKIFPILALALIGELSLCLWLMVKGVNLAQWEKRATESA